MFKYLVISFLAILFSVANVSAQKAKGSKTPAEKKENFKSMTPEQRADAATKRMTKRYTLTTDQATKVQAENLSFTNKIKSIQATRQTNKEQFRKDRTAARQAHRDALKAIFDDKQDALFEADLAARKKRQEARRAAKGKAPKGSKKGEDATIFESLEDDEDEE